MTDRKDQTRAPAVVRATPGQPLAPVPPDCHYGDADDAFLAHIDEDTDQDELSRGRTIKRFA